MSHAACLCAALAELTRPGRPSPPEGGGPNPRKGATCPSETGSPRPRTREDAAAAIQGLSKSELVKAAQESGIPIRTRDSARTIEREIVEGTGGVRSDHDAIRDSAW